MKKLTKLILAFVLITALFTPALASSNTRQSGGGATTVSIDGETHYFDGAAWHIYADTDTVLSLDDLGGDTVWSSGTIFSDLDDSSLLVWEPDGITVAADIPMFNAVVKLSDGNKTRYVGIDKTMNISTGTFDGKTWFIPDSSEDITLEVIEDWAIKNIWTDSYSESYDDTTSETFDVSDTEDGIIKLINECGKTKYIGIQKYPGGDEASGLSAAVWAVVADSRMTTGAFGTKQVALVLEDGTKNIYNLGTYYYRAAADSNTFTEAAIIAADNYTGTKVVSSDAKIGIGPKTASYDAQGKVNPYDDGPNAGKVKTTNNNAISYVLADGTWGDAINSNVIVKAKVSSDGKSVDLWDVANPELEGATVSAGELRGMASLVDASYTAGKNTMNANAATYRIMSSTVTFVYNTITEKWYVFKGTDMKGFEAANVLQGSYFYASTSSGSFIKNPKNSVAAMALYSDRLTGTSGDLKYGMITDVSEKKKSTGDKYYVIEMVVDGKLMNLDVDEDLNEAASWLEPKDIIRCTLNKTGIITALDMAYKSQSNPRLDGGDIGVVYEGMYSRTDRTSIDFINYDMDTMSTLDLSKDVEFFSVTTNKKTNVTTVKSLSSLTSASEDRPIVCYVVMDEGKTSAKNIEVVQVYVDLDVTYIDRNWSEHQDDVFGSTSGNETDLSDTVWAVVTDSYMRGGSFGAGSEKVALVLEDGTKDIYSLGTYYYRADADSNTYTEAAIIAADNYTCTKVVSGDAKIGIGPKTASYEDQGKDNPYDDGPDAGKAMTTNKEAIAYVLADGTRGDAFNSNVIVRAKVSGDGNSVDLWDVANTEIAKGNGLTGATALDNASYTAGKTSMVSGNATYRIMGNTMTFVYNSIQDKWSVYEGTDMKGFDEENDGYFYASTSSGSFTGSPKNSVAAMALYSDKLKGASGDLKYGMIVSTSSQKNGSGDTYYVIEMVVDGKLTAFDVDEDLNNVVAGFGGRSFVSYTLNKAGVVTDIDELMPRHNSPYAPEAGDIYSGMYSRRDDTAIDFINYDMDTMLTLDLSKDVEFFSVTTNKKTGETTVKSLSNLTSASESRPIVCFVVMDEGNTSAKNIEVIQVYVDSDVTYIDRNWSAYQDDVFGYSD